MSFLSHKILHEFLNKICRKFPHSGQFYLIGETSLVFEGWRQWAETLEFTAEVAEEDRTRFSEAINAFRQDTGIQILEEHPGDLIPLPDGFEKRAIPIDREQREGGSTLENGKLKSEFQIYHFDPYSVAFRFIARGDEQDYQLVLTFLEKGWLNVEKMDALLSAVLPRFSFQAIQQDPAEFRRKYKSLMQMWQAHSSIRSPVFRI